MKSRLPFSPRQAISASGVLKFVVNLVCTSADIFRFWKYPLKKAAADFKDMTLRDKIYWVYKSQNHITLPEKGSTLKNSIGKTARKLVLPKEFKKEASVTFSAVGDLIKIEGIENSKDVLFEKVADYIFKKDISFGNLESIITKQELSGLTFNEKEGPPLCCSEEHYDVLKGHKGKNFTLLNTACNHTMDMGMEGWDTTLSLLEKDNIVNIGTNRDKSGQQQGMVIDKNGIKIGLVSATFGLNGKEVPDGKAYMVNVVQMMGVDKDIDLSLLENQISWCQEQGCDFILASLHWGHEYEFFPRVRQVEVAHRIVELGADLIVSHHPHVIQPVEYYQTQRDPDRIAVITYSLGNVTTSFYAPGIAFSAILNLSLNKGKFNNEEKTYIDEVKIIPVVQMETQNNGSDTYQIQSLKGLLEDPALMKEKEKMKYLSKISKYKKLVFGGDPNVC
jgi:poly-gamma-glutamate capsule biosynthesis protein CapA/YwtB (metallophosphatase superfamily)